MSFRQTRPSGAVRLIARLKRLLAAFFWFRCEVQGCGFKVQGSEFRVQSSGFQVQGSGLWAQGCGFRAQGLKGSEFKAAFEMRIDEKGVSLVRVNPKLCICFFVNPKLQLFGK